MRFYTSSAGLISGWGARVQHATWCSKKKKKGEGDINMRRKEAKSLRITNGVIVYLGKSRELPKKLLELMREFSKAAE